MGDFRRHQVRAIMVIEKDQEILSSYQEDADFIYGSREFRRKKLLENNVFLCECLECSLEGEDLEENDGMRAEIREKEVEVIQLLNCEAGSLPRRDIKKIMKLAQGKNNLVKKLNLRLEFVTEMILFYRFASMAKNKDISWSLDPDIYRQEALKYAKMFGESYIHFYEKSLNGV